MELIEIGCCRISAGDHVNASKLDHAALRDEDVEGEMSFVYMFVSAKSSSTNTTCALTIPKLLMLFPISIQLPVLRTYLESIELTNVRVEIPHNETHIGNCLPTSSKVIGLVVEIMYSIF